MTSSEFRRIRRGTLDLTQAQLAEKLGISPRQVWLLENGSKVPTRYELALRYLVGQTAQPAAE